MREDLDVVALTKAAGTTGRAVVLLAQGLTITEVGPRVELPHSLPRAGRDSLQRAGVMLADMEARSGGTPDGDGQRVQRHDDLRGDSGGSNDHSQRLWVPSRSGPNAILPEEASCSSNGRSCVMVSPVL